MIVGAVVALLAAGTLLGVAYGRASSKTTSAPTSTTAPLPPVVPDGTYQVSTATLDAGTTGAPAATPGSRLATTVWFPAARSPEGGLVPDHARAPYPLLVFSQGYKQTPARYDVLLTAWASAGFVVAAPTYPHTDDLPPYMNENDIFNHPAELRTVVAAVLALARSPGSALSGLVKASEIGLVGQSDGGDVSLAVAANTCCRLPGVKAVAVLSGAELKGLDGTYFAAPTPPLLVVQDNADTVNIPACSAQIYDDAPPPKWYLGLLGAANLKTAHLTPYVHRNPYETVVAQVTTDFFDATLAGQTPALRAMGRDGDVPGVAQLSDGATVPVLPTGCPGAP